MENYDIYLTMKRRSSLPKRYKTVHSSSLRKGVQIVLKGMLYREGEDIFITSSGVIYINSGLTTLYGFYKCKLLEPK